MVSENQLEYKVHPLRETLYHELHARPFYPLETPKQMTHLAAHCGVPGELDQAYDHICELCRRYGVNPPQDGAVAYRQNFGDFVINWERHSEFYSLTIMHTIALNDDEPFHHNAVDLLPADWMKQLPGHVITAFHMIVDDQQLDYTPAALSRNFEGHTVMQSATYDGKAHIYTAFKLHGDGYGRIIIQNRSITDLQTGRLVRRLTDLENYRLLAFLALPVAKRITPLLLDMDQRLAAILADVADMDSTKSERELLNQITKIEAQLETCRAKTTHRLAATHAYYKLVKDRQERIDEIKVEGHLSLKEFVNRRLNPALRTCESTQKWMEDLSKRIERASDLLRTRVNLNLQEQNRSQLKAMNQRSELQFRLQETVEGLSIAAISYYAVGLLSYLLKGLPLKTWGLDKNVVLACSIPVVLTAIWMITNRIKRRLIHAPKGATVDDSETKNRKKLK